MSLAGAADPVSTRRALLDALEALNEQRAAVVLVGAQAIYLHTGGAKVALPEATKDADLAIDRRVLTDDPLIEEAMTRAGFLPRPGNPQPGAWVTPDGIPVDLMVPASMADPGSKRGALLPPHSKLAMRTAAGLEAAMVDNSTMDVQALDSTDRRSLRVRVAGPSALLVAKCHKIGERRAVPDRLVDKDAHDAYRLLVAVPEQSIAAGLSMLLRDPLAGVSTAGAIAFFEELFASGSDALGSVMAGRAETGLGDPDVVAASAAALAGDVLAALSAMRR